MMSYDKPSVVVSVILLCLALYLIVELPMAFSFTALGHPMTVRFSLNWLATAILVSMACAGTASIMRLHPLSPERNTFVRCILPGLATLLATLLLPQAPDRICTLGGLVTMGILLLLIIAAEYRTIDPTASGYRASRLGLNFIAYLIALALFTLIHESKAPALLVAAAALVGSGLLALDLLHGAQQSFRRTGLYALIVGLVMGEIVWALSYSKLNSSSINSEAQAHHLTAGILLLLIFYFITGLSRQGLLKLLNRRIFIEFAVVVLIGLALLLKYAP
jgi:hypothetical protein